MAPKYSNILYFNIKPKMGKGLVGKEDGWIWGGGWMRERNREEDMEWGMGWNEEILAILIRD
jgi:hypothetical protein